jgi:hypothetical protein
VFHRVDGQHRVGLRVDATVGDVDTAVAEQVLEQQRTYPAKCAFDGLLIRRAKHTCRQDVGTQHPLHLDQMVVPP